MFATCSKQPSRLHSWSTCSTMTWARMLLPSPMSTLQVGQSVLPSLRIRCRQVEQVTWPFGHEGTELVFGTKRHTGQIIASFRAFKSFLWVSKSSSFCIFSRALMMRAMIFAPLLRIVPLTLSNCCVCSLAPVWTWLSLVLERIEHYRNLHVQISCHDLVSLLPSCIYPIVNIARISNAVQVMIRVSKFVRNSQLYQ